MFESKAIMKLVACGKWTAVTETPPLDSLTETPEGGSPLLWLRGVDCLDNEPDPLLVRQVESLCGLQQSIRVDGFNDLRHDTRSITGFARAFHRASVFRAGRAERLYPAPPATQRRIEVTASYLLPALGAYAADIAGEVVAAVKAQTFATATARRNTDKRNRGIGGEEDKK